MPDTHHYSKEAAAKLLGRAFQLFFPRTDFDGAERAPSRLAETP